MAVHYGNQTPKGPGNEFLGIEIQFSWQGPAQTLGIVFRVGRKEGTGYVYDGLPEAVNTPVPGAASPVSLSQQADIDLGSIYTPEQMLAGGIVQVDISGPGFLVTEVVENAFNWNMAGISVVVAAVEFT